MATYYSIETEQLMFVHYSQLSERSRRQYAGIEAQKLGHGGTTYISKLFKISRPTIIRGITELKDESLSVVFLGKQRKSGGGRKKILSKAKP